MKIFDPKLTGSIEIQNTITGDVTLSGNLIVDGNLGGAVTASATASYVDFDNIDSKPTLLSGSAQIASDISGSFTSLSSSVASGLLKNTTDTLTGDLTVTGTLTAQEFHTEFTSASVIYESGSTQFGNSSDDTHVFRGELFVSASDVEDILTSKNYSATGAPDQLKIQHSSGDVIIKNARGGVTLTGAGLALSGSDVTLYDKIVDDQFSSSFLTFNSSGNSILSSNDDTILGYSQNTYIKQSGNVGIKTSSAGRTLVVNGDFQARGLWTNTSSQTFWGNELIETSYGFLTWDTGYATVSANTGLDLRLGAGSTDHVYLKDGGTLGVGVSGPSSGVRLQATGKTSSGGANAIAPAGTAVSSSVALFTNGDPDYGTLFGTLNTGHGWIQQQRVDGTATTYNLFLQPNGGKVGIGTNSIGGSGGALTIVGSSHSSALDLNNTSSGGQIFRLVAINGGGFSIENISTSDTNVLRVDANSNIGIGTSGPGKKLHIVGNQLTDGNIFLTSSSSFRFIGMDTSDGTDNKSLYVGGGGAASGARGAVIGLGGNEAGGHLNIIAGRAASAYINFLTGTSSTEKMRIDDNGRVGIGTTPQTWGAFTPLQVEDASLASTGGDLNLMNNVYYDGTNYKYIASQAGARQYFNTDGTISFHNVASGTAGNNLTWNETLRIDTSGRLLVGKQTTSYSTEGVEIRPNEILVTNDGGTVLSLNRLTDDGVILSIAQDTATVANIGSNGADLYFSMDQGGGIGIGTTSASHRLHVHSGATNVVSKFESSDGLAAIQLIDNSGNVELVASGDTFQVQPAGGAAKFWVNSSGDIAINNTNTLRFNTLADNNHAIGYDSNIDGVKVRGYAGIKWQTGTGGGTDRMKLETITEGSAVAAKLTISPFISGTSNRDAWLVGVDDNHSIRFRVGGTNKTHYYSYAGDGASVGHMFYAGGAVASQGLRFSISSDRVISYQDVGIGTSAPDEKLHVNGNVAAINSSNPTFKVQGSDVNYQGRMRWDTNNNVLEFLTRHAGTYYSDTLVLKQGDVGIGTNAPDAQLDIYDSSIYGAALSIPIPNGSGNTADTDYSFASNYALSRHHFRGSHEILLGKFPIRDGSRYLDIKTNINSNSYMFGARAIGYLYNRDIIDSQCGGYAYTSNSVINLYQHESANTGRTIYPYRASGGELCFRIDSGGNTYSEGQVYIYFYGHGNSNGVQVNNYIQNDSSTNYYA